MELEQLFKQLDPSIKKLGVEMVDALITSLESKNKVASRDLINSVKYEYQVDIDNIKLFLKSEDYLTYIEKGRRPNKYVPIAALKRWAGFKGIPEKAIYAINHKIFKFGIKPVKILEPIVNEFNKPTKFGGVVKQYNRIVADYLKYEFEQIEKNMK